MLWWAQLFFVMPQLVSNLHPITIISWAGDNWLCTKEASKMLNIMRSRTTPQNSKVRRSASKLFIVTEIPQTPKESGKKVKFWTFGTENYADQSPRREARKTFRPLASSGHPVFKSIIALMAYIHLKPL